MVDVTNTSACAASGRLWESLLEDNRLPYVLLRVADLRMTLGSKVTALALYEEVCSIDLFGGRVLISFQLQSVLKDPAFATWVSKTRSSILDDAKNESKSMFCVYSHADVVDHFLQCKCT